MHWILWVLLPLPVLSIGMLVAGCMQKGEQSKLRALLMGIGAAALVLSALLFFLAWRQL